jgi:hypothetical protein
MAHLEPQALLEPLALQGRPEPLVRQALMEQAALLEPQVLALPA